MERELRGNTSKLALWLTLAFLFRQMKIVSVLFLTVGMLGAAGLTPVDLRVEFAENPVGVSETPHLSWNLQGEGRGGMQKSYELLAAGSSEKLTLEAADLWKQKSEKSSQRAFLKWEGAKLKDGQKVFWIRSRFFSCDYLCFFLISLYFF